MISSLSLISLFLYASCNFFTNCCVVLTPTSAIIKVSSNFSNNSSSILRPMLNKFRILEVKTFLVFPSADFNVSNDFFKNIFLFPRQAFARLLFPRQAFAC